MVPRAPSLPPDERRAHLIDRTLDLLRERGNAVTTREIAEAAGVAEGTLFRAFSTKEELVTAALRHAFDPADYLAKVAAVEAGLPLRDYLSRVVTLIQQRFIDTHELMTAMGLVRIPDELIGGPESHRARRTRVEDTLVAGAEAYSEELRVSPRELVRLVRMLTFSGSHPHLSDGKVLEVQAIVDTVLYGVAKASREPRPSC